MKAALSIALILTLISPSVFGYVFRSDDEVYLTDNYEDDLLLFGTTVNVDGLVTGDVITAANTVNVNGDIDGNVIAFGWRVTINGDVRRSVRGASWYYTINSHVGGDLMLAAQDIFLGSDAVVMHDAALAGAELIIDGVVEGDCELRGGTVTITGQVYGNVTVEANSITVSPSAVIEGDFEYESGDRAKIAPEAQILGDTKFRKSVGSQSVDVESPLAPPPADWLWSFLFFCGTFVLGLILILFKRDMIVRIAIDIKSTFLLHGLLGLLLIVISPIVLILVGILPIGWPITVAGFSLYTLIFVIAKIFVGITLGMVIIAAFKKKGRISLGWSLLLGMLILALLFKIPVLGWLIYLAAWAIGTGALTFCFFRRKRVVEEESTSESDAAVQP